ncbi:MAG TPA: hypothetical protein VGK49_03010 [Ilumatobacteraceae bacterium]
MSDEFRPVVELRSASIAEVRFPERMITVLAVPYETPTDKVLYRGRQYRETFARGAFAGVEERNGRVRVNREHRKGNTVGKVAVFHPDAREGLVADLKIVASDYGDETLALAAEDMISPSVRFAVKRGSDQELNNRSDPPTRYVRRAFVDHLGLVEDPAYDGADVLSVRAGEEPVNAASLPQLKTPRLDEWVAYLADRRAGVAS